MRARKLGAQPQASQRARQALQQLAARLPAIELVTCAGEMGEAAARAAGLEPEIVHTGEAISSAADTRAAAACMLAQQLDLLLFAGGDGTARELLRVLRDAPGDGADDGKACGAGSGGGLPVLGIPAGVKMHSGVFAVTAKTAGDVAARFLSADEPGSLLALAEVMDRETADDGSLTGSPQLYGYLPVPRIASLVQVVKAASPVSEGAALEGACRRAAQLARETALAIVGPGTTMLRIKELLGARGSLLGVDVFAHGVCIGSDVGEQRLLELLGEGGARIFVTVIGGQGFVFGRGNQQISAQVLRRVAREDIIVVASLQKLTALPGGVMRVDTGAEDTDAMMSGYIRVLTGGARSVMCRVVDVNEAAAI